MEVKPASSRGPRRQVPMPCSWAHRTWYPMVLPTGRGSRSRQTRMLVSPWAWPAVCLPSCLHDALGEWMFSITDTVAHTPSHDHDRRLGPPSVNVAVGTIRITIGTRTLAAPTEPSTPRPSCRGGLHSPLVVRCLVLALLPVRESSTGGRVSSGPRPSPGTAAWPSLELWSWEGGRKRKQIWGSWSPLSGRGRGKNKHGFKLVFLDKTGYAECLSPPSTASLTPHPPHYRPLHYLPRG